jgi:hypothetical protein
MPFTWSSALHGYANGHITATEAGRRRVNAVINAGLRDGTLRPVTGEVLHDLEHFLDNRARLHQDAAPPVEAGCAPLVAVALLVGLAVGNVCGSPR